VSNLEHNKVLTASEIKGFKSMDRYWEEARERNDTSNKIAGNEIIAIDRTLH